LSLYIHNQIKNDKDLWTPTLQYYSTFEANRLMPIVSRLAILVSTASEVKLKSVYNKYSQPQFQRIARAPEMIGAKINGFLKNGF
jgi:hypothetical protein